MEEFGFVDIVRALIAEHIHSDEEWDLDCCDEIIEALMVLHRFDCEFFNDEECQGLILQLLEEQEMLLHGIRETARLIVDGLVRLGDQFDHDYPPGVA